MLQGLYYSSTVAAVAAGIGRSWPGYGRKLQLLLQVQGCPDSVSAAQPAWKLSGPTEVVHC